MSLEFIIRSKTPLRVSLCVQLKSCDHVSVQNTDDLQKKMEEMNRVH